MVLWRRGRARTRAVPARLAASAFALAILGVACGKAANVFFDLPERADEGSVRPASAPGTAPMLAQGAFVQDTGPPPPIESISDPDSVLALLPMDRAGNVDWMAALKSGVIRPRRALLGEPPPPRADGFQFDFLLKGMAPMFDAYFPHSSHVQWLGCQTCHPTIFPYRGAEISMNAINQGEFCGRCHGPVAFPTTACGRCHLEMGLTEGSATPDLGSDLVLARADTAAGSAAPSVGSFPLARFPHWTHRIRYRCSVCHTALFEPKSGSASLTMADLRDGKACGACHNDRAAFGVMQCNRCHVPVEAEARRER